MKKSLAFIANVLLCRDVNNVSEQYLICHFLLFVDTFTICEQYLSYCFYCCFFVFFANTCSSMPTLLLQLQYTIFLHYMQAKGPTIQILQHISCEPYIIIHVILHLGHFTNSFVGIDFDEIFQSMYLPYLLLGLSSFLSYLGQRRWMNCWNILICILRVVVLCLPKLFLQ